MGLPQLCLTYINTWALTTTSWWLHPEKPFTSSLLPPLLISVCLEMKKWKIERNIFIIAFLEMLLLPFYLVVTVKWWWCKSELIYNWLSIQTPLFCWYCTTALSLKHKDKLDCSVTWANALKQIPQEIKKGSLNGSDIKRSWHHGWRQEAAALTCWETLPPRGQCVLLQ